jgi:glycosyltransferase involved in cell wall biosynthesis
MRVLHLFSNHKWTGPAELAVNACLGLRGLGLDARLAVGLGPWPGTDWLRDAARARGLEPVLPGVTLSKHIRLFANRRDARSVAEYVAAEDVRVLHAHLPNDHWVASGAARRAGSRPEARARVPVVRTFYDGLGPESTIRNRFLVRRRTDAAIAVSAAGRAALVERFGFPGDRLYLIEPPVDTARFDPARADLPDMRPEIGLAPGDFAVGIVARMQWHRRFDVFLAGIARAVARVPHLKAVVVGRGTNQEPVAKEPARALGLGEVVRFPGYLEGDRYVGALTALDVKIFLVPGSDGSCRAVREAMAVGKPAIVARRGMLPEIVTDGRTGLVIDDTPEGLGDAIIALASDPARVRAMGAAARADAVSRFSIARAAEELRAVYEAVLAR